MPVMHGPQSIRILAVLTCLGMLASMVVFPYLGFCLLMVSYGSVRSLLSGHGVNLVFPNPLDILAIAVMIIVPIFCVFAFNALRQVMEAYGIVEKLYEELKDQNRAELSEAEMRALNLIGGIKRERLRRSQENG
jgi:hypothetical protein